MDPRKWVHSFAQKEMENQVKEGEDRINVGDLAKAKAKKLLSKMAGNPFVTFVFEEDKVTVYSSNMDEQFVKALRNSIIEAQKEN